MTFIIGIDEAGRGPVIGPLVMCGVSIEEDKVDQLIQLGVKDSKLLSKTQREYMFNKIKEIVSDYKIHISEPKEIDNALESSTLNLNWLEATHSAQIMNELHKENKKEKLILDCPSTNINAYSNYVKKLLNCDPEIICEHKADMKYHAVGAASILAKVVRDREIEKLQKLAGEPFGSGYPSDPKTRAFLEKNWDKFDFFRKTWSSWKKHKDAKKQSSLSQF